MLCGMDEVFLERPVLDKAQRAALREPNDALSARHLLPQLIWMGGTLAATVLAPDPWRWVAFALHGRPQSRFGSSARRMDESRRSHG